MQKIFYNARFLTMNEKFDESQAMLVNNDSIVFVGSKEEVFKLLSNSINGSFMRESEKEIKRKALLTKIDGFYDTIIL